MGSRILVIEDNPTNLELVSYILTAFGHEVVSATDGEAGIATAKRERPDLIISDIQMPGISGYEVAERLKRTPGLAAIPIVALTALAMVDDRRKVLASGFDGYIAKPIRPEALMETLAPFLAGGSRPPVCGAAAPPHAEPAEVPRGDTGAPLILVVDNNGDNIRLARSLLEPSGYRVEAAADMETALAAARRLAPALILADLHMPGGTGFDLLAVVRADHRLRATPFVLLSATVWRQSDRDRALALGADAFLFRPIESELLLREIAAVLHQRG